MIKNFYFKIALSFSVYSVQYKRRDIVMRILIIEDEKKLAEALANILTKNKYAADIANDGEAGLDCILSGIYDLVVLDIMLPKKDGYEILRETRKNHIKTPVIMLTAKDELSDKVKGLDCGADDYLTKPFQSDELLARIRALSRRNADTLNDEVKLFGDIEFNNSTGELKCRNKSIALGSKESQIMDLLLKYGVHILSKEDLLLKVWGFDSDAEYNNVEVYISFLRKKLSGIHSGVTIKTVRGIGYKLEYEK